MATPSEFIGLGMPSMLANLAADHLSFIAAGGSSAGSATQIPGPSRVAVINASNSGSGLLLPAVTGDNGGSNRTDYVWIANLLTAAVQVYAANTQQGSSVTIFMDGGSIAGLTGFSVSAGKSVIMTPVSVSTYVGFRSA